MAKYTFHKYNENVATVVKVADNTADTPAHTVVTINTSTFAVTVKTTAAAAGDFLVWRKYPTNGIYGDRYGKTTTPNPTGIGELYGFKLKAGDSLLVEDAAGISGLTNGQLLEL